MAQPQQHPRTVIFLGAGASAAEGAPVQGAIFEEYFRHRSPLKPDDFNRDASLDDFFGLFFGMKVNTLDKQGAVLFPTFEEVLGVLELAIAQEETFRGLPGRVYDPTFVSRLKNKAIAIGSPFILEAWTKGKLETVRNLVILLIAEVLDKRLENAGQYHRQLLDGLDGAALAQTWFISLNYDILIDNAILDLYPEWDLDYHVDFARVEFGADMPDAAWHSPRHDHAILLLKLHGSLNWLYCPTCRAITLTPKQKKVCHLKWRPEECICNECGNITVPIVIPPSYFKALSNLFLREMWDRAEKELSQTQRIVFCGYSFPDADMHIKYLLKRAEMNRRSDPPEVFIVNEHKSKPRGQWRVELERYLRFFRAKDRVHWTKLSFEQFAQNPGAIEDRTAWRRM